VLRYTTEIVIPADRYVCLQLPEGLAPGPATLTIVCHDPTPAESEEEPEADDVEWWEEFEDREP
jgi:hypothetical protein